MSITQVEQKVCALEREQSQGVTRSDQTLTKSLCSFLFDSGPSPCWAFWFFPQRFAALILKVLQRPIPEGACVQPLLFARARTGSTTRERIQKEITRRGATRTTSGLSPVIHM